MHGSPLFRCASSCKGLHLTFAALQETQLLRDTKVLSMHFGDDFDTIDDIAHANCLTTNVSLCTCLCNELELGSASIVEGYPPVRRRMYGDQFKRLRLSQCNYISCYASGIK